MGVVCIYVFICLIGWWSIYLQFSFPLNSKWIFLMTVVCVLYGDLIGHLLALRFHGHGDQMLDSLRNPINSFILKLIDLWVNRFLPCFVSAETQTFCVWKGKGKLFMFLFSLLGLRLFFFLVGRAQPNHLQEPAKPEQEEAVDEERKVGKTHFVEHRTGLHLYHSFHRFWIFLVCMLQVHCWYNPHVSKSAKCWCKGEIPPRK